MQCASQNSESSGDQGCEVPQNLLANDVVTVRRQFLRANFYLSLENGREVLSLLSFQQLIALHHTIKGRTVIKLACLLHT